MSTNLQFEKGLPPTFLVEAWASEPLTTALKETNIPFALPEPDANISLIVKESDEVIGQCSANKASRYWSHLENIEVGEQNLSTQIFISIHKKAVAAEREYLKKIQESEETSFHAAGIAILPSHRGRGLGKDMRERQIELCKANGMRTLFCETTNRYSAGTVEPYGFVKVAEFLYKKLAEELNCSELSGLGDDAFTVWCWSGLKG